MKRITAKQRKQLIDQEVYPSAVRVRIGEAYTDIHPTCVLSRGGLVYKSKRWATLYVPHKSEQVTTFIGPITLVVLPKR